MAKEETWTRKVKDNPRRGRGPRGYSQVSTIYNKTKITHLENQLLVSSTHLYAVYQMEVHTKFYHLTAV
jgi:hypothetical protein